MFLIIFIPLIIVDFISNGQTLLACIFETFFMQESAEGWEKHRTTIEEGKVELKKVIIINFNF